MARFKILENRIKIFDSYMMSKAEFLEALDEIQGLYPDHIAFKRSRRSMILEWQAHNFLYWLGIKKDKTADVDLDYPQPWIKRLAYGVLGVLGKLFNKVL